MQRNTSSPSPAGAAEPGLGGVLYALAAFGIWGFAPIYFRAVGAVPASEVVAHRIVWAMLLLGGVLCLQRRGRELLTQLRRPGRVAFYSATAMLVSTNWLVFIWSIQHDRLLEASLGYYINPLVNVVLGVVFLRERLNAWQLVAIALATVGVLNLVLRYGTFPWIALTLGFSFGFYGLLRKKAVVDAILGLTIETLILTPFALLFLGVLAARGAGAFGRVTLMTDALLALSGVVTAVPLVCFLQAARRLRLATVGLMQYLAPTLNFLLAVITYHEPFTVAHALTFACIWTALVIYSLDAFVAHRAARPA